MDIKPIRGEADYDWALRRVEELWNSPEGSAEGDEFDILATLIEAGCGNSASYPNDEDPTGTILTCINQPEQISQNSPLIIPKVATLSLFRFSVSCF
jgi:antitoxin component HigA of HigAB toxin-antitoxin module